MMTTESIYKVDDGSKRIVITDGDPKGPILSVIDFSKPGEIAEINLPRVKMIEALEYLLLKLKAREVPKL